MPAITTITALRQRMRRSAGGLWADGAVHAALSPRSREAARLVDDAASAKEEADMADYANSHQMMLMPMEEVHRKMHDNPATPEGGGIGQSAVTATPSSRPSPGWWFPFPRRWRA